MSSIRIFILSTLEEHGPLHGHRIRSLARQDHTETWTDIKAGSIYAALKRLQAEEWIELVKSEKEGNRPERSVYAITEKGREALAIDLREALARVEWRTDPFDLALARAHNQDPEVVRVFVQMRRDEFEQKARSLEQQSKLADPYLTEAERVVMRHLLGRARAELAWHEQLLKLLPGIVRDWKARKS